MIIQGVDQQLEQEITDLAVNNGIEKIVVFGSRSRGDFRRTSDIDLAVSGGNISKFMVDVEEDTRTLLRYDIVNLDKPVEQELLNSIKEEGKILYEKV